jgi:acyl-CoA thioesterase
MANMEQTRAAIERDAFAKKNGVQLIEVQEGVARAQMRIWPEHINGMGSVQGGAIFTLADLAFAAAVNSHGNVAVAVNVSISFLKAAQSGTLYAEAQEIARGSKLASCTVRVTDDTGDLVAIFQGMAYRKKETLAETLKKS